MDVQNVKRNVSYEKGGVETLNMEEAANWATESGEVQTVSNGGTVLWDYWGTDAAIVENALNLGGSGVFPEAQTYLHVWTDDTSATGPEVVSPTSTRLARHCTGFIAIPPGKTLRFKMKVGKIASILLSESPNMPYGHYLFNNYAVSETTGVFDGYSLQAVEIKSTRPETSSIVEYVRFNLSVPPYQTNAQATARTYNCTARIVKEENS